MMAYTQENVVSSTQEIAENNLGTSRESCDSLGAVPFCSFNYAKGGSLPSAQIPKYNLKETLDQKKVKKKKSKNGKKKEKKKKEKEKKEKKQKPSLLDSNESFKETVNCLEMLNRRCRELVLLCKDSTTVHRLSGFMSIVIEFLKKPDQECLTKPSRACIVKPLLKDIVYLIHLAYSGLRKLNFDNKARHNYHNYLNKMSDLLAMVIDVEITTSKLYACKKCKGKSFKTKAKLKEHLKKSHEMETSGKSKGESWKDDDDSDSNIGIAEEEKEKLISVLLSSLYLYLDNSSSHILDTMLKTTNKNKNKYSEICSGIFSRILQSPPQPMGILDYTRHILVFKMWRKMLDSIEQRKVTVMAASLLPQPPVYFRERVAVLEGIMPRVIPSAKPDSSVTEYCLSDESVKYELKDQIQKYLELVNNPQKITELVKKLAFFSENRVDFDVNDSVFAVDDEDLILYDTFSPDSPTKSSAINKNEGTDKSADKKAKSSATVDCQTDSKIVADLSDKTELVVTSSNEEREQHEEIAIKSEVDVIEVSDAQSNSLDNVCVEETLKSEESSMKAVNEDTLKIINENITRSLFNDLSQKVADLVANNIAKKTVGDKSAEFDVSQEKLHELFENLKKLIKPAKSNVTDSSVKSPEEKSQILSQCAASSENAFTSKLPYSDDTIKSTSQTSSISDNVDFTKTSDMVGKDMDFQKPCSNANDPLYEPWLLELVGKMEKCIQRNSEASEEDDMRRNFLEGFILKPTLREDMSGENGLLARATTSNGLIKSDEDDKRRNVLEGFGLTPTFREDVSGENGLLTRPTTSNGLITSDEDDKRRNFLEGFILKPTFREDMSGENGVLTRPTTSNGLMPCEEDYKRRNCNLDDDFMAALFSEEPDQSDLDKAWPDLNSLNFNEILNVDDLPLMNNVDPTHVSTPPPLLTFLMDEKMNELALADDLHRIANSSEEGLFWKGDTQPAKKMMSSESVLSPYANELNFLDKAYSLEQKSSEKRAMAESNDDQEEPQRKRSRSSSDAQNYLLTPPSTPVASESAKNQVESQKDASINEATTSENLAKSSPTIKPAAETVNDRINQVGEVNASPAKQVSSENRASSPSKNVISKHCVADRPMDSAKDNVVEKPTIKTPECTCDQRLSGSMIDYYFKYFHRTILSVTNQNRTYIFSVSFYPLLTSDSFNSMKLRSGLAEKRHSQVEHITRNDNIFEKDFIIFPIEKNGHWLVVIVCFPGLTGPVEYQQKEQIKKHFSPKKNVVQNETSTATTIGKARRTRLGCNSINNKKNSKEAAGCDTVSNNKSIGISKTQSKITESNQCQEDRTSQENQPIKQPCILVFDSSPKPRRTEVVQVIRDYLRVEYKVKHGKDRDFPTFMKDSKPKVPMRDNSDCCGVYMLQYADSFFNNPIVDFRLPIKHLQNWFPPDAISRKREEINRLPRPSSELNASASSASQMLHVKSCQKGKDHRRRRSSDGEKTTSDKSTETVLDCFDAVGVLDCFDAVGVLDDCNTSDPFRGFEVDVEDQPPDTLITKNANAVTAQLIAQTDDDNAMMNVINEEEVVTSKCTISSNSCTPEPFVALSPLSRSVFVSPPTQEKKKRTRTRTATTALTPKKLPPSRRKNVSSENATNTSQNSMTTSKKNEPANKAAKKSKKPMKRRRRPVRRREVVSPPPKSGKCLRSTSNEGSRGKDDDATSIPLRSHHLKVLCKFIEKMDGPKKRGRRSKQ